jgi:hypothetical protein
VPERVKNALGGKSFVLTGSFSGDDLNVVVLSGGKTFMVWPKNQKPDGTEPAVPNDPWQSASGTTNAMDGTVVGENEKFEDFFETDDHFMAKIMAGHKSDDVAMYEATDPTGKDKTKRYYLIFGYKGISPKDNKQAIFRQKPFEIFNAQKPLPAGVTVQGLTKSGAVVKDHNLTGYHFVSKTTKDKGVMAVFQNRSVSAENAVDKEGNCVGPIVWWGAGMDREKAQKACEEDKL